MGARVCRKFGLLGSLAGLFWNIYLAGAAPVNLELNIQVMKSESEIWTPEKLKALPQKRLHEKLLGGTANSGVSGNKNWNGVAVKGWIDQIAGRLTPEQNAEIDLIVLENEQGQHAMIPRSFINKYPVVLAQDGANGWVSIAPWSEDAKALKEKLPLESFYLAGIKKITLAYSREFYGEQIFLKKRTDPLAVRGEKIFVQTCLGCHGQGGRAAFPQMAVKIQAKGIGDQSHTAISGFPKLQEADWRSVQVYVRETSVVREPSAKN